MKYNVFYRLFYRCICYHTTAKSIAQAWSVWNSFNVGKMVSCRQALLLSSSNCYGYSMLEFAKEDIMDFLKKKSVKDLLFVPYAQNDYDGYTAKIKTVLGPWGYNVIGIHKTYDQADAIMNAKAIFIGGGNTFLLLSRLYEKQLVNLIKDRVHRGHLLYIGSSAGTNVATRSINTTNDMPIIQPPTFEAIGIVPFNINPHYIEMQSDGFTGESRDQRIWEYLEMENASPVLALREGSMLYVNESKLSIKGVTGAVLFTKNGMKVEYMCGSDVSFLVQNLPRYNEPY